MDGEKRSYRNGDQGCEIIRGLWRIIQKSGTVFFSEEKKQKTFVSARAEGYGTWPATVARADIGDGGLRPPYGKLVPWRYILRR
jgi:hypothetical protein